LLKKISSSSRVHAVVLKAVAAMTCCSGTADLMQAGIGNDRLFTNVRRL
jgi:hypothetical protein